MIFPLFVNGQEVDESIISQIMPEGIEKIDTSVIKKLLFYHVGQEDSLDKINADA